MPVKPPDRRSSGPSSPFDAYHPEIVCPVPQRSFQVATFLPVEQWDEAEWGRYDAGLGDPEHKEGESGETDPEEEDDRFAHPEIELPSRTPTPAPTAQPQALRDTFSAPDPPLYLDENQSLPNQLSGISRERNEMEDLEITGAEDGWDMERDREADLRSVRANSPDSDGRFVSLAGETGAFRHYITGYERYERQPRSSPYTASYLRPAPSLSRRAANYDLSPRAVSPFIPVVAPAHQDARLHDLFEGKYQFGKWRPDARRGEGVFG